MSTSFELVEPGGTQTDPGSVPLEWPGARGSGTFTTDLSWDLGELGTQSAQAADLLRIVASAFLADKAVARGSTTWTREIRLKVPVTKVATWRGEAAERLADLLWWLTGDRWELDLFRGAPFSPSGMLLPGAPSVMLLSGGLDSLCGAVTSTTNASSSLFVGHQGTENAVRHAQNVIYPWIQGIRPAAASVRRTLVSKSRAESTSRTRSLLFMALGVAAAEAGGTLFVPENGFTSVNLALRAGRGGACSTRSTHPATFRQVNAMLAAAGITVAVSNPYAQKTKGEMLGAAAKTAGLIAISAESMSCSKLNGHTYKHGNSNTHCGLCVACAVRRASYLSAGVTDPTVYLVDTLPKASRTSLIDDRRSDIDAIKFATRRIPSVDEIDDRLVASAVWEGDQERRQAAVVYRKGLKELALVPLP